MKDLIDYFMGDPDRARLIYFVIIVVFPMVVLSAYILAVRRAERDPLEEDSWQREPAAWLSCAVADNGGVSVYGLQSRPVTLYAKQWLRLATFIPAVVRFIADNHNKVVWRDNEKPSNLNEIAERLGNRRTRQPSPRASQQ
jgi:hypothetical protein